MDVTSDGLLGGDISPEEMAALLKTPGGRIRFMRLTKGLKQSSLAEQCHTTQASISLYETGDRKPGPLMRRALADALGVSTSWIFTADGTPPAMSRNDGTAA